MKALSLLAALLLAAPALACEGHPPAAAPLFKPASAPSTPEAQIPDGIYAVRATAKQAEALVPAEGDRVAKVEAPSTEEWHLIGLEDGLPLSLVAEGAKRAPRGANHFDLVFNAEGKARLTALTQGHLNQRLAIVVDGVIKSAPIIKAVIDSGRMTITCGSMERGCVTRLDRLITPKP